MIGCGDSIRDDAAIAFTRAFYRAIAHGNDYSQAFALARNDVRINCGDAEADKYVLFETSS